jgi:hypothetical protein
LVDSFLSFSASIVSATNCDNLARICSCNMFAPDFSLV